METGRVKRGRGDADCHFRQKRQMTQKILSDVGRQKFPFPIPTPWRHVTIFSTICYALSVFCEPVNCDINMFYFITPV